MRPSLAPRGAPVTLAAAVLLIAASAASCDGNHPLDPGPHTPGIQVVSGGNVTDTINATLHQRL